MIDFRQQDSHEHGLMLDERVTFAQADLKMAQRVRNAMRAQGMRVPLTEAEQFAEAERQFRGQS